MRNFPSPWTPPVVEQLHVLLAEQPQLLYGEIAQRLNEMFGTQLTKNACIGFAKRNGVPTRNPARASHNKGKKLKPRARPRVAKLKPKPKLKPRLRRPAKLRIWQLLPDECRWPIDSISPYFFCAVQKIPGSPYCLKHTQMSYPALARRVA